MPRKATNKLTNGQVRIIAGQCRGRRISFPAIAGLRPTGDRLRETLFNWLSTELRGARCLDLFAGSGALGLEAASRGASEVILLELNPQAARALSGNIDALGLQSARVCNANALKWLQQSANNSKPFDIIFLDPPFNSTLLADAIVALAKQSILLAQDAKIYIETPTHQAIDFMPDNWQLHRHKTAGDVACYLYHRRPIPVY
ncbi:MAG: 16S rRNA (guanine(966)-N(2))-methyltransferase RsmD [Porticoccaceae bacterium]|nr:16S rRNA (guanine(966)-N(2))-methyltransferase RsmD [Porticoccaceae bacterium]